MYNMSEHDYESISDLKKSRSVVKRQLSMADRLLENLQNLSKEVVKTRISMLEEYWDRFSCVQRLIEIKTEEEELDKEVDYRMEMEDKYYKLMDQLQERWGQLTSESQMNTPDKALSTVELSTPGQHPRALTSTISFIPFQEDESFKNFIRRLEVFLHLHGHGMQPQDQVYTLLHALTPQLHQKLYDLCAPENPLNQTYTDLVDILMEYVDPKASIWGLQHQFLSRIQRSEETVKVYSVELQKLTSDCAFNCEHCNKSIANTLLRMQFIRGLRDTEIRTRLLQEKPTKCFQEVVKVASTLELAKNESNLVETNNLHRSTNASINQVLNKNQTQQPSRLTTNSSKISPLERLKGKCYRCGSPNHRARQCKFIKEMCRKCNKQGHIASVCLGTTSPKVHSAEVDIGDLHQEQQDIYKIQTQASDKFLVNLLVEGQPIQMELDTGAAISILPYSTFKRLNINKQIFHTNVELRTYSGEVIKPKGVVFVKCSYKNQTFVGKLYIVNQDLDAIFGRDWMREVQLDWAELKKINNTTTTSILDELLNEFKDLFEPGIGKIPDTKGHLQLVEGARPIFIKARPIPFALKEKVEKELDRLEEAGIISKTEKSEWGTPIVPVVKPNGNIRICADFKVTVNKQIKDEHHPIPRIEDIFAQMNGGQLFCTLDLSNAYLHLEMDSESADIQTLSTHKGQYNVNRLMFGVKVAPGIWQKLMDGVLQNLEGVQCFFDDIIIQGRSEEELLTRLRNVFESLRRKNLRLNRDKCKFFQKKIQYLGHVIDEHGIHKSKEKVTAITEARRPQNVNELRSFLGLVNYYNRFIKDLSTLLYPLHQLLQKGKPFRWSSNCEHSFQTIKEVITSDTVLSHFNPDYPLVLATDASPVGLGAVISHRYPDGSERPIAFASRTLTKAERHYSQIDKEATGIYWGLKKFFSYCYGRQFTLITDHKPLVAIFSPHKSLPSMSASRLFNYSHFLSGFNYQIEFKRTSEHGNADFLSRFPVENINDVSKDQHHVFQTNQINTLTIDHKVLAAETVKDPELGLIVQYLQEGKSLESLGYHDNELTLHEGCLFKGWKVVIPTSLKKQVLNELHFGHVGILKTKALARSYCCWRGMDKDIENMIAICRPCREKQNAPAKEMNHPWEPATKPWERIHVDFMGPTNGQQFMIVVDAFSKWVEVIPTRTTTAEWTVKELRKLFSTFGLPNLLISDNGRNFTSTTFQEFVSKCGTIHKTTAPFHPSSNGQAERFVQTVKKSLKSMLEEPGSLETKLHRVLMQLRQVPNSTGNSAYFLMFNRRIRTYISLLVPPQREQEEQQPKGIVRQFMVGDRVQVRNYNGQGKWSLGQVQSRDGNLHYYIKLDSGPICRRHVDQMLRSRL